MKIVLVIEDETRNRDLLAEGLEAENFYTIAAKNGLGGVQKTQKQLPDSVNCDIIMPPLNGYGVLNTLRQEDSVTATTPFIFLTAKVTEADHRQVRELGADNYFSKPCTLKELLGAIAVRLQRQDALQQCYTAQPQQVPTPFTKTAKRATAPQSIFPSNPKLSQVFHFIDANYHQPIVLKDVAQATGYSPAYLTDLVRRQTGQTLCRWIVERRMIEARSLLLETDQAVNQIAKTVGYPDAGHFNRQFRKFYGMPPKAWRNLHRT